jgi:hypothetical protein
MGLAGMEDAQIKSGNGLVKRDGTGQGHMDADIEYSRNYAKIKKAMKPDGELTKLMAERRKDQAAFRAGLEAEIKKVLLEEERRH